MRESLTLQAILANTTETLARELAQPTAQAPDWSHYEWRVARAVAAMHGVSPLLSRRLNWRGPAAWQSFLEQQHQHTALRHRRIDHLLSSIAERTAAAGIGTVALKGVALHALGVYAPGERPMADIDLLVRPWQVSRMAELLTSLGFRASVPGWKEQVFTPLEGRVAVGLGEHADNPIKIELHQRICERLPLRVTDVAAFIFPADLHPGINPYPSRAALLTHLLLHAAGSMAFQSLRMLHLYDIAAVARTLTGGDWEEIACLHATADCWWIWAPLRLVSAYHPAAVPLAVLQSFEPACPSRLARVSRRKSLTDVSYSYLGIDAFPGVEWARSLPDVIRYLRSRLLPSADHLLARAEVVQSQRWAANSRWPEMSQLRRAVSWALTRPGRPVTLHSVNASLAESP